MQARTCADKVVTILVENSKENSCFLLASTSVIRTYSL
jgi:hypothetical protein